MSIASEVERIARGKALVAAAVTEKGVETPAGATFQQIAENVAAIESGGSLDVATGIIHGTEMASAWVIYFDSDTNTSQTAKVGGMGIPEPPMEATVHAYVGSVLYIRTGIAESGLNEIEDRTAYEVTGDFSIAGRM